MEIESATPADLAYAAAAFRKLKEKYRALKALSRERARTISALQDQIESQDDRGSSHRSVQQAEACAREFVAANSALRRQVEKESIRAKSEIILLKNELEETKRKNRDYTDQLRLVIKELRSELQMERDKNRKLGSKLKNAVASVELLTERNADTMAKAHRAEQHADECLAKSKGYRDEICALKDEIVDLRRDHKALLAECSQNYDVFKCDTETLATDIMNLRHEKKRLQDELTSATVLSKNRLKQALNDQHDRHERELETKMHTLKMADDAKLKALADQLSIEKAQRLSLETRLRNMQTVDEKENDRLENMWSDYHIGDSVEEILDKDSAHAETIVTEESDEEVEFTTKKATELDGSAPDVVTNAVEKTAKPVVTPNTDLQRHPPVASASLSFNIISSIKSSSFTPSSDRTRTVSQAKVSDLTPQASSSYEKNYALAIESLQEIDNMAKLASGSQIKLLASKLKSTRLDAAKEGK